MSKKKANGEGSITKRTDGRFMARYTIDGKRKAIYGKSHNEVRKKLNEILNQIAIGEYTHKTKETLETWLRSWLVSYAFPTVKQSTYISYEGYVRLHIGPELGHISLQSLKKEQVQLFFNNLSKETELRKALQPKTIKNIYRMFHYAMDQAVENHKILTNPLNGIKLPKQIQPEIRVLSTDEQHKLQQATKQSQQFQAFGIIFTLNTGLRLGELLGLKWKDVNYQKHSIKICRTAGRLQKIDKDGNLIKKSPGINTTEIVVRTPKSISSKREIPLFDNLWDGLMKYRDLQTEVKAALESDYDDQDYIFCKTNGQIYDPRVFEDLFKRTVCEAGIDDINFHALRHTFATRALESGMDIKVLSSILGHAQTSTTLNLYGHSLPDHKRVSMDKMKQFYFEAENPKRTESDTNGAERKSVCKVG